jgi:hypothetical protein
MVNRASGRKLMNHRKSILPKFPVPDYDHAGGRPRRQSPDQGALEQLPTDGAAAAVGTIAP